MQEYEADIFFRCMRAPNFWNTSGYAWRLHGIPVPAEINRNTNKIPGVTSFTFLSKIKNMTYQKPTMYMAALFIGCLSLSSSAFAQSRVAGESPSGSTSGSSVTRPTYFQGSGSSGGGSSIRPTYLQGTGNSGSGSSSVRPLGYTSAPSGDAGQSDFTRPLFVAGTSPVGQQTQTPAPMQMSIHPNPATELFYIELNNVGADEPVNVEIFSERGQRFSVPMERMGSSIRVQSGNMPRGRYLVQVKTRSDEATQAIELI